MFWLLVASCTEEAPTTTVPAPLPAAIFREELILALQPNLRRLEEVFLRGSTIRSQPELFAPDAQMGDVNIGTPEPVLVAHGISRLPLTAAGPDPDGRPLASLIGDGKVLRATTLLKDLKLDEERTAGTGKVKVDLLIERTQLVWVRGYVQVDYRKGPDGWRIHGLRDIGLLQASSAPATLFVERLEELTDEDTTVDLRASIHEAHVAASLADPSTEPDLPFGGFEHEAFDRHPGLALADVDGDGWDEILVVARWGDNRLLKRQADGQYADVAAAWGLAEHHQASAPLFVDLDGDGDLDLFLGRALGPSLVLLQEGGRFDPPETPWLDELTFVSSVAAADVDGDGRQDLYVATYAASKLERVLEAWERMGRSGDPVLEGALPAEVAAELGQRLAADEVQFYVDRPGPPNALLLNRGDRFERQWVGDWRNTYQASFSDLDDDGDPDLYLANDFGPNQLLWNEDGVFVDGTEATGSADFGFGMGVGFGDVDGDGAEDLYVSNMYSSAGNRVLADLPDIDERIRKSAAGNTLLLNRGHQRWEVSDAPVQQASWSWGGQLVDLDLDGQRDLYVPNGYYTAPASQSRDHDS